METSVNVFLLSHISFTSTISKPDREKDLSRIAQCSISGLVRFLDLWKITDKVLFKEFHNQIMTQLRDEFRTHNTDCRNIEAMLTWSVVVSFRRGFLCVVSSPVLKTWKSAGAYSEKHLNLIWLSMLTRNVKV